MFGIDVARWNGNIDWDKVRQSEEFAILKVTKKNNVVEDSFETNYKNATKAGMKLGGYRYVYANTVDKAKAEANAIVEICRTKNLPFGIWLDMEDMSIRGIGRDVLTSIIDTEAGILRKAGLSVGIYCNLDWYCNILNSSYLKTKYPFWIARYPANDVGVYNPYSRLNPSAVACCWQYSSKGRVEGILGKVDLDKAFTNIPGLFIAHPTLKQGNKGLQVVNLQTNLNKVVSAELDVDGSFGPKTHKALTVFQSVSGLQIDGIYGPNSAATMRKLLG